MAQLFTELCDENMEESRLTELVSDTFVMAFCILSMPQARLLREICYFAQAVKSKDLYLVWLNGMYCIFILYCCQVMKQHGLMASLESMLVCMCVVLEYMTMGFSL